MFFVFTINLKITRLTYMNAYMYVVIMCPNVHPKFTKNIIKSNYQTVISNIVTNHYSLAHELHTCSHPSIINQSKLLGIFSDLFQTWIFISPWILCMWLAYLCIMPCVYDVGFSPASTAYEQVVRYIAFLSFFLTKLCKHNKINKLINLQYVLHSMHINSQHVIHRMHINSQYVLYSLYINSQYMYVLHSLYINSQYVLYSLYTNSQYMYVLYNMYINSQCV